MPSLGIAVPSVLPQELRFGVECCGWSVHLASTGTGGWLISRLVFYESEVWSCAGDVLQVQLESNLRKEELSTPLLGV